MKATLITLIILIVCLGFAFYYKEPSIIIDEGQLIIKTNIDFSKVGGFKLMGRGESTVQAKYYNNNSDFFKKQPND